MTHRVRFIAEYLYPGTFFPEETICVVTDPSFASCVDQGPDDEGTYFYKNGWYAVRVRMLSEKRYHADDGEQRWISENEAIVRSYIVGTLTHVDDIPDSTPTDSGPQDNSILKSNIRSNSRDPLKGYAVLTRCGNWQIASDYREGEHRLVAHPGTTSL